MTGRTFKIGKRWAYRINLGFDAEQGAYRFKKKQGFATKDEAQKAMAAAIQQLEQGAVDSSHLTVGTFLTEWLARAVEDRLAPKTLDTYTYVCDRFLIPALGSIRLEQLNAKAIEALYTSLHGQIAPSSVHRVHRVLRTALNRAIKWGYLERSPMLRVEAPSGAIPKRTPLAIGEVKRVVAWMDKRFPVSGLAAALALYTGMRRGEICGLSWTSVDWDARVVRVVCQRQRLGGKDIIRVTKTAGSVRAIPVDGQVMDRLRSWREEQQQQTALRPGDVWSDSALVLRHVDGTVIDPNTITADFRDACRSCGISGVSFHDLRHTHATLLLLGHVPLKVVSERLGHASIAVTANLYSHVTETLQREAVDVLTRLMRDE